MPTGPYKTLQHILITRDNLAIYPTLVALLDKLSTVKMGSELLADINASPYTVTLSGVIDQSGSACTPLDENHGIVLLAFALKSANAALIKNELFAALSKAQKSGITIPFLLKQIAQGLPPATYRASVNVQPPQGLQFNTQQLDNTTRQRLAQLNKLLTGDLTNRDRAFELALRRVLRPWLQAGRGCACIVDIDLNRPGQHRSDGRTYPRDIVVSLGHEFIHAWHFTRGKVLTWSGEPAPDLEELMTVGLPPYNFEKFSENMFRGQSQGMDMRLAY